MTQYHLTNAPTPIREQLDSLTAALQAALGDNLIGVYLHGSLTMGRFNPERSDLDLLVVIRNGMDVATKRRIVEMLLERSGSPAPIEVSVLTRHDLHPWRHSAPYDLHFSEVWRQRYEGDLAGDGWRRWNDEDHVDPDLAAHVTITRQRGAVLIGPAIEEVFPEVPKADYLASILADYRECQEDALHNPVYAVLNMARVYRYLVDGAITSKDEAGVWALGVLPEDARQAVRDALAAYRGAPADQPWTAVGLRTFMDVIDGRVAPLLSVDSSTREVNPAL